MAPLKDFLIDISLPVPLNINFTYKSNSLPAVGARVRVPFGRRNLIGICLGISRNSAKNLELKYIEKIIDESPLLSPVVMKLAHWMSSYYMRPLGDVLKTIFPSTLRSKNIDVEIKHPQIIKNKDLKLELNKEQMKAVQKISMSPRTNAFLLHGVTGSGKTRVYLSLLNSLEEDEQALVLVPEISLTPQITAVFESLFPKQVAVIHSALTDKKRWEEWLRIKSGSAKILIGARSAVFAPFKKLKLIVIDEEHDASYKQNNGLCYNGRDIGVFRAQLEGAMCVLGSATPSMESYYNALEGKYSLVELTKRVVKQGLPNIEFINSRPSPQKESAKDNKQKQDFLSPEIINSIRENKADGGQCIVLVNRRGYAFYLYNPKDSKTINCPNCSISLTVHNKKATLICHYCNYTTTLRKILLEQPNASLIALGTGSQKAEETLKEVFPLHNIKRIDSDVLTKRKLFLETISSFRSGEVDTIVGTQIMAKGHDFPNVSLVVISEIDGMLNLPDFRSGERTFQLIVQAAGRAGRSSRSGKVILKSSRSDLPAVRCAIKHDYKDFAESELNMRKNYSFPPFSHLIRIEWTSLNKEKLEGFCKQVDSWAQQYFQTNKSDLKKLRIQGPATPPIEIINNRHRRVMVLCSTEKRVLHNFAATCVNFFKKDISKALRILVDVDPISLL